MKVFRKYYMLFLLILTLTVMGVYGTYAMFTHDINVDAVNLQASNIPVDQEISEYQKITVNAHDAKTISLNLSNSTSQVLHYGAWYEMVSPTTINDNITIAKLTDSPDETSGTIDGNSNKTIYIYVGNNTSSAITLYVGIKYSETSSLGLPDNRTLITNTRDGKYVVGVTVTNGTVENGKTITNLVTNGSFENGSNGWSLSNASVTNTQHSDGSSSLMLNANTTAMSTQTLLQKAPILNHQYYGKLNFLSSENFTNGDNRYEWYYTDGANATLVFANKDKKTTDWMSLSNILSINVSTYLSNNWNLRNFIVNGNTASYVDNLVIFDLTDSYGSNYLSKEILDRSISYFDGSVSYNYQKLNKGNNITFEVYPEAGYVIDSVSCTNSSANYNNNTLTITNITGDVQCNVKFKNSIISGAELVEQIKSQVNSGTPNFGNDATTDEGIYSAPDDYGTSYYFRGAVENNYVKFADKYWRIIRINGDGTIRLIYDGTSAHANGERSTDRQIGTSVYNNTYGDNAYVGYMMGIDNQCTSGICSGSTKTTSYNQAHSNTYSSTIKKAVDNWYKTNIVDAGYSDKVADVIYCNDRSMKSGTGYGTTVTYYGAYQRIRDGNNPVLTCTNQNDRFTVEDTSKGNGALTYPVGLITIDEVEMAGVNWATSSNSSYYLYTGNNYWTMSPSNFNGSNARGFSGGSYLSIDGVNSTSGVRPVLSLKSGISVTGSGTQNDPYVVQ